MIHKDDVIAFLAGALVTSLVFLGGCAPHEYNGHGVSIYSPEPGVKCYAIAPYDSISCVVKP